MNTTTEKLGEGTPTQVIESLFMGEDLAAKFIESLNEHQAHPVAVAFAVCFIDRTMTKNMPDWMEVRKYAQDAYNKIVEAGLLEEEDPLVTDPAKMPKTNGRSIPKKFEKPGSMIVKVQTPIATNAEPGEVIAMVYNEDRSYDVLMQITPDLLEEMKGEPKKFFYAHYDRENNDTILEKEAEWQTW